MGGARRRQAARLSRSLTAVAAAGAGSRGLCGVAPCLVEDMVVVKENGLRVGLGQSGTVGELLYAACAACRGKLGPVNAPP